MSTRKQLKSVTAYVNDSEWDQLRALATERETTVSGLLRQRLGLSPSAKRGRPPIKLGRVVCGCCGRECSECKYGGPRSHMSRDLGHYCGIGTGHTNCRFHQLYGE